MPDLHDDDARSDRSPAMGIFHALLLLAPLYGLGVVLIIWASR